MFLLNILYVFFNSVVSLNLLISVILLYFIYNLYTTIHKFDNKLNNLNSIIKKNNLPVISLQNQNDNYTEFTNRDLSYNGINNIPIDISGVINENNSEDNSRENNENNSEDNSIENNQNNNEDNSRENNQNIHEFFVNSEITDNTNTNTNNELFYNNISFRNLFNESDESNQNNLDNSNLRNIIEQLITNTSNNSNNSNDFFDYKIIFMN
jgi:hypothetical protein